MHQIIHRLFRDPVALGAAIVLSLIVLCGVAGPMFFDDTVNRTNLRMRHVEPFALDHGMLYILGGDALGRSVFARLIIAARTTMLISITTVTVALIIAGGTGIAAGLRDGWFSGLIMRAIDVLMSIPSLLFAMVFLYALGSHPIYIIAILAITRIPVFARVARAETLEIRQRGFSHAARVMGASDLHVLLRHVAPMVLPTLLAIAALEFAVVMLAESTLTFLGIGVQAPDVTWGMMVAEGRDHLSRAWWPAVLPGVMIATVAVCATILGNWFRVAADPTVRTTIGATANAIR